MKFTDGREFEPLPEHEVVCKIHGVTTTWGALDAIQQMAVEEGIDSVPDSPCLLLGPGK